MFRRFGNRNQFRPDGSDLANEMMQPGIDLAYSRQTCLIGYANGGSDTIRCVRHKRPVKGGKVYECNLKCKISSYLQAGERGNPLPVNLNLPAMKPRNN